MAATAMTLSVSATPTADPRWPGDGYVRIRMLDVNKNSNNIDMNAVKVLLVVLGVISPAQLLSVSHIYHTLSC